MKNILINYLSTANPTFKNYYQTCGAEFECEGYLTNEPVTKYCIWALNKNKEKLDYIIPVCSRAVLNDPLVIKEDHELYSEYNGKTTLEYYEDIVSKECKRVNSEQTIILDKSGERIEINDVPEDTDVEQVVVDLAVAVNGIIYRNHTDIKDIRIMMDFTGGDRLCAAMMVALTKILQDKGFKNIYLYGVNFFKGSSKDNRCQIRSKQEVSKMFDMITGIHEFLNYGNARTLKTFFDGKVGEEENEVLESIQSLASKMQLNTPNGIKHAIGCFFDKSEKYLKLHRDENPLFTYVLDYIREDYGDLKEIDGRTPLNIVKWCLKKGLIQQAVTIYCDLIPVAFVDQKIAYYDVTNWDKVIDKIKDKIKWHNIYDNEMHNRLLYSIREWDKYQDKMQDKLHETPQNLKPEFIYFYAGFEANNREDEETLLHSKFVVLGDDYKDKTNYRKLRKSLKNYYNFRRFIRNSINHASYDFKMDKAIDSLDIPDKKKYRGTIESSKVSDILTVLVDDLADIGMK